MITTPRHAWARVSGRESRCVNCNLIARSKRGQADGRPYTLWILGDASWDSRTEPGTPPCPPLGHR